MKPHLWLILSAALFLALAALAACEPVTPVPSPTPILPTFTPSPVPPTVTLSPTATPRGRGGAGHGRQRRG